MKLTTAAIGRRLARGDGIVITRKFIVGTLRVPPSITTPAAVYWSEDDLELIRHRLANYIKEKA